MFLKQSTASQVVELGPFVDSTDFVTAETALSIANTDIKLRKGGGTTHGNKNSGGATHIANGYYHLTLDATDTDTVGVLDVHVNASGALPVFTRFYVIEEAVYDALFAASSLGYVANAPVNVAQFGGVNGTFASGRPEVNASTDAVNEIADGVWDEAISGHLTAGSTGNALNAAGSAGDPWSTALPGAYGAGTAGKIIGDNLNATVSSRASQTSVDTVDDFLDTEIAAIKAKTDNLPASPAATGDIPSAATVADAVWDEARAGHVAAGSFGEGVASVQGNVTGNLAGSVGSVTGAVGSVTGAVGSVTGSVGSVAGNVSGSVGSIATGGISSASFAAGAIDAAAIAANAIGASELAADAVDEILDEQIGDTTITMRQALKLLVATLGGKLSGAATTTVTIRNAADTADVVTATVDANGNRTAVTLSL